jgi:catalase
MPGMVHPCGSGAFGYFECTQDVTELTVSHVHIAACQQILTISQKANFLCSVGEKTPAFVRFSTVTLGREFPDEARNPRGFAIKLYTMEGNYDIVGLNFVSFLLPLFMTFELTVSARLLLP